MSEVNKKIFNAIDESSFPDKFKELLKTLLNIELRNSARNYPLYAEDYDRAIKKISGFSLERREDE